MATREVRRVLRAEFFRAGTVLWVPEQPRKRELPANSQLAGYSLVLVLGAFCFD